MRHAKNMILMSILRTTAASSRQVHRARGSKRPIFSLFGHASQPMIREGIRVDIPVGRGLVFLCRRGVIEYTWLLSSRVSKTTYLDVTGQYVPE